MLDPHSLSGICLVELNVQLLFINRTESVSIPDLSLEGLLHGVADARGQDDARQGPHCQNPLEYVQKELILLPNQGGAVYCRAQSCDCNVL